MNEPPGTSAAAQQFSLDEGPQFAARLAQLGMETQLPAAQTDKGSHGCVLLQIPLAAHT
jgi:hypothetical protein